MRTIIAAIALLLVMGSAAAEARTYTYCKSTVTGKFITRANALNDRAHARCVPALPDPVPDPVPPPPPPPPPPKAPAWLVVMMADGTCQIWLDTTFPPTPGWTMRAKAATATEAWVKLQSLYSRGVCQ
jgi:hypothetical protein